MPYFCLDSQIRQEIAHFIKAAKIKGSQASKLVEVAGLLSQNKEYPYVSMTEDQSQFLLEVLGNLEIRGDFALVMTRVILALSKPFNEIPKEKKPTKKPTKKKDKRQLPRDER
jgi:hypothetical protein